MDTEQRAMTESETAIDGVLSGFRGVTDALVQSSNLLKDESVGIKAEIGDALVQLQFQDRVSQVMNHVRHNMDQMPDALRQPRIDFEDRGELAPLDATALLRELEKTYAMASEHAVHRGIKAKVVQSDEVTFF